MVLSDGAIRRAIAEGRIGLEPLARGAIQPASVDVRVNRQFLRLRKDESACIDVREPAEEMTEEVVKEDGDPFILHPGEFVLAHTLETLTLPDDLVARLDGKSSLGRLGLLIHKTAGWCDPGFSGTLTLELSTVAAPITIWPGMAIGQLSFMPLDAPAETPYGAPGSTSKYQGQSTPTASRYHRNFAEHEVAARGAANGNVLRGERIREIAVAILLDAGGEAIHYREWLRLVEEAGYTVAGQRPDAVFLNQVVRSPLVRPTSQAGVYELDRGAPARLRRRVDELRAAIGEGAECDLSETTAELRRESRRLAEAERGLEPSLR
jgi:dCTP deaminase